MAKKRRSPAQRAAFKKMIAALHRKRSGRSSSKRAKSKTKRKQSAKTKRRHASKAKTAWRTRHVSVMPHTKILVHRRQRKASRKRKSYGKTTRAININPGRRSRRRHARRNPALSVKRFGHEFVAGITGVLANLKAAANGGVMGYATIGLGAVGSVFAGTMLAGVTAPRLAAWFPAFATSPIGSRVIAFLNYYAGGFLLAKFAPGLSDRTRRGILAGATAASIIEVIRPGTIKDGVAMIPGVGPMAADKLSDYEMALSDDVMSALSGRTGADPAGDVNPEWNDRLGMYTPGRLGAYTPGRLGAYTPGRIGMPQGSGIGAYALSGSAEEALGCVAVDSGGFDAGVMQ